ncbi:hypothetical protein [Nocardiopsis coralliicola]
MTADSTGINPEPDVVAAEGAPGSVVLTVNRDVRIQLSGRAGAAYLTRLAGVLPEARALLRKRP